MQAPPPPFLTPSQQFSSVLMHLWLELPWSVCHKGLHLLCTLVEAKEWIWQRILSHKDYYYTTIRGSLFCCRRIQMLSYGGMSKNEMKAYPFMSSLPLEWGCYCVFSTSHASGGLAHIVTECLPKCDRNSVHIFLFMIVWPKLRAECFMCLSTVNAWSWWNHWEVMSACHEIMIWCCVSDSKGYDHAHSCCVHFGLTATAATFVPLVVYVFVQFLSAITGIFSQAKLEPELASAI